jgi:hypothetical protein
LSKIVQGSRKTDLSCVIEGSSETVKASSKTVKGSSETT